MSENNQHLITIITPTIGERNLSQLVDSLGCQKIPWVHIVLWDNKREENGLSPSDIEDAKNGNIRYHIEIKDNFVNGIASGSSLRAIGLMASHTPYVTFGDSDVFHERNHFELMMDLIKDANWAYCRRKIWTTKGEYLGIDGFESVGDSEDRKVPYEMVDNNCMIFKREFGASGAVLYRETKEYNDDRLFYAFLKQHAGKPNISKDASVHQYCPKKLESMFRTNCSKIT